MAFEFIEPFLWALGVGISLMAVFTFYWPKYQLKLMKLLKLKPSVKTDDKIRKLAILKLAVGLAILALTGII